MTAPSRNTFVFVWKFNASAEHETRRAFNFFFLIQNLFLVVYQVLWKRSTKESFTSHLINPKNYQRKNLQLNLPVERTKENLQPQAKWENCLLKDDNYFEFAFEPSPKTRWSSIALFSFKELSRVLNMWDLKQPSASWNGR